MMRLSRPARRHAGTLFSTLPRRSAFAMPSRIPTPMTRMRSSAKPASMAIASDRLLLASLGFVGGGVVVREMLMVPGSERCARVSDVDGDSSWVGQIRASIRTVRRRVEAELEDDNHRVLLKIIAANTAIWGLWRVSFRVPVLERLMWRHFACSYDAVVHGRRVHTLITSAFSHITLPHIAINMFMLWEFGRHVLAPADALESWLNRALARSRAVDFVRASMASDVDRGLLSVDDFLRLYMGSAVASSTLSIVVSRLRQMPSTFTIGASGAVMGVLTVYCLLFPERRMMLYGLFDLTASELLQLMTAVNLIGAAFQRNLHIDFTGHLGGQATGLALHETPTPSRSA